MNFALDDTIAAPASANGRGLRGILRVSGREVRDVLHAVFEPNDERLWRTARLPRRHAGQIRLPELHSPIPVAVHLWPTSRSYTAQPTAEIHMPAAPPLMEAVLAELYRHGARAAKPGEFTLRAFLAGRIDLMQAEAVLGVIDANEQAALQRALEQLAGGISGRIAAVHRELLELLSDLEAGLDFVEEDIEFISQEEIARRIDAAMQVVDELLRQSTERMESTGSLRVVIAGLPNAGKSTLFNALVENEAAIVSEHVGTTRDSVRAEVQWGDVSVELFDTAGWEAITEGIAGIAQRMRTDSVQRADVILWCRASDLSVTERERDAELFAELNASKATVIDVQTKADLESSTPTDAFPVSAATGVGLHELRQAICETVVNRDHESAGLIGTTAARCCGSLAAARAALQQAREAQSAGLGDDLVSAEIREALNHLGEIVGAVYTDDLLDRIFSKFCIGK